MSYILEAIQKNNKTDWQKNIGIKQMAKSSVNEKDLLKKDDTDMKEEKKRGNSSQGEQIFHPVDRIF